MSERTIERSLHIAAPRPQVFRALMDPGTLSRWLFATVSLRPEEGTSFSFEWRDTESPATARGEILELIPDSRLVLSWFMEADGIHSVASFDLADAAGGTGLRFRQSGLPAGPEWNPRFRAVALEWDKVLLNLRFLLEERGEGKHLFYLRQDARLQTAEHRAFCAWTTVSGLAAWLARDVFAAAEEGQRIEGITLDTGRKLEAEIVLLSPDRHIRFLWSEGGVRGLLGVSFWPGGGGVAMTITLRSFALLEIERRFVQELWEKRFQRLSSWLERPPLGEPILEGNGVRVRRTVEGTGERVWNALTDAALLRRWFVNWTDLEPRPGASFILLWDNYGEIRGRVEDVRPVESLRLAWEVPELPASTSVSLALGPESGQPGLTRVEAVHEGFAAGAAGEAERRAYENGWTAVLALLDFYLRHGAGKERRDLHLRRRAPFPPEQAGRYFVTAEGLGSWTDGRAAIEGRPGGVFRLEGADGTVREGRVVVLAETGEGAVELARPEPAFLEWSFGPDPAGSRLSLSLVSYSGPEWLEAERSFWRAALDRLAGNS